LASSDKSLQDGNLTKSTNIFKEMLILDRSADTGKMYSDFPGQDPLYFIFIKTWGRNIQYQTTKINK
jgi:hypothetical protein